PAASCIDPRPPHRYAEASDSSNRLNRSPRAGRGGAVMARSQVARSGTAPLGTAVPRTAAVESGSTRQRILEVALDVFAEYGFEGTSTREICKRAQVNAAAINYHWG